MNLVSRIGRPLLAFAGMLVIGVAAASDNDIFYERDVPYVPTPPEVVEAMLDLGRVWKGDYLIDLGSGDGRIPIAAALRGAYAYGVDINPIRVKEAQTNAALAGVTDRVRFEVRNLFDTDISRANVLTMYLLPLINIDLKPRILRDMQPGTRVVSHAFQMGRWTPDDKVDVRGRVIYLWIVPARVTGRWEVESEEGRFVLDVDQIFQTFIGTARFDGRFLPVQSGHLKGAEIAFAVDFGKGPRDFRGRVDGDTITGIDPQGWKAARKGL
jgi:hypothetical protein